MKKRPGPVPAAPAGPASIRSEYERHGVDDFYRTQAEHYRNPHFPQIRALLLAALPRLDTTHVLDFAAGGGEVTQVLQEAGRSTVTGCDPYTWNLYTSQTGRPCLRLSFRDVIQQGLPEAYSAIVCSFALHLCPEKDLFSLTWNLLQAAPVLVVITPHKRPELERFASFRLIWEDAALTDRGKKVRLKAYGQSAG